MQHVIRHNIPNSHQVPNKSTETALARINNDILANDICTIIVFSIYQQLLQSVFFVLFYICFYFMLRNANCIFILF